jgi:hypothetical protein
MKEGIISSSGQGIEGAFDSSPSFLSSLLFHRKTTATTLFLRSCGFRFFLVLICHRYYLPLLIVTFPGPRERLLSTGILLFL